MRAAGKKANSTPGMAELIGIKSYSERSGCFLIKGGCLDILRVICSDFQSIREADLEYENLRMEQFYSCYPGDIKLVCVSMPEHCGEQIRYVQHKIDTCDHPIKKKELVTRRRELEWLEKNRQRKEYYLFLYAESPEQLADARGGAIARLLDARMVLTISAQEKMQVLEKMMNPEQKFFNAVRTGEKKEIERRGYDPYLISSIQPAGGIRFQPSYIQTGSSYGAILTIYDWKSELDAHWLSPLVNQDNIIVSVDMGAANLHEVKQMIDRSFTEQRIRFQTEHKDGDQMDAGRRYQELKALRDAVANQGESLRYVTIRIYVSAKKMDDLEDRLIQIRSAVETAEYHCTVMLHEQKLEWQSMLLPYKEQQKLINHRDGQILPCSVIGDGNPFNFSYLSDPYSCYYGSTPTAGTFNFNIFTKTSKRLSYNGLVYGMMGSGKSTLLKKIIEVQTLFGDYVRVLDPSGEYKQLVQEMGGKYLSLDGSDGILNEFDIQKVDENEGVCWVQHVSKMAAIYRLRRQNQCDQNELNTYSKLLLDFYIDWGIIPEDGKITEQSSICGLPPERYPTMSDFLDYINRRIENHQPAGDPEHSELGKKFLSQADEIRSTYENLVRNYGYLLDGHTSITNISTVQLLCFNIKTVLKLEPAICSGVLYNALMLFWDHCVRIGSRMKELYESGKIQQQDIIHSLVVVDESHHILNAQYADCVRQMTTMAREMRKYFSGIIFATQLITDNLKGDGASSEEKTVQDLFDLATYRFIGKQTATCIPILEKKFPGMYTETELYRIPSLDMGSFIVSAGDQNLEVRIFITETENRRFEGGR